MSKFRNIGTLKKFASVHASTLNLFKQEPHLNRRDILT